MTKSSFNTATGTTSVKEEKPIAAFPICFYKDAFIPWERATLHANSLAMRYALSVFEGIRVYVQSDTTAARAFRLEAHLDRLRRSLQLLDQLAERAEEIRNVENNIVDLV